MSEIVKKEVKIIDNTQWKERHQFVLSANGNIICQRYFKVNGFNPKSLHSQEFEHALFTAVQLIKDDLASKSRIYTAITMDTAIKLTGFYQGEELSMEDAILAYHPKYRGKVELSNGVVLDKTYLDYEKTDEVEDDEPFEFKFEYLFDDKPLYTEVWDGTVYPKYVRNCVDLSNSDSSFKYVDPMRMSFSQNMTKSFVEGKKDLIYTIIRMFCDVMSNVIGDDGKTVEKKYTDVSYYGNKKYSYSSYPRDVIRGWAEATRKKTIDYQRWVNWDLPQSKLDYINRYK